MIIDHQGSDVLNLIQLCFSILIFSQSLFAFVAPHFEVVAKDPLLFNSLPAERIVYETQENYILKSSLTNFVSYDYYVIHWNEKSRHLISFLKDENYQILHQDKEIILLQTHKNQEIFEVAEKAHSLAGACGVIQKISEEPLSFETASVNPWPGVNGTQVKQYIDTVELKPIMETIETMQNWQTRYHSHSSGVDTGEKLLELYKKHWPTDRTDVEFELISHSGSQQKSLLVRVIGKSQPNEILILGSHLDSINSKNKGFAPGADDNASGTATNLEVFRALMSNQIYPERTVEIHAYAAEEIGLIGSGEMAVDYKNKNKNVKAMVQFDMNGYTKTQPSIYFVSNSTNSELTQTLMDLARQHLSVPVQSAILFMGSSDHASWHKRGYPVAFPTENPSAFNRSIHTDKDTMDGINSPEQILVFAKLGLIYALSFAGF